MILLSNKLTLVDIENLLSTIDNNINIQAQKRKILLICMDKISNAIDNIKDVQNTDILFTMLNSIKDAFEKIRYNSEKYKNQKDILINLKDVIENLDENSAMSTINLFNDYCRTFEYQIDKNNYEIDFFILNYVDNCHFTIPNSTVALPEASNPAVSNNNLNFLPTVLEETSKQEQNTILTNNDSLPDFNRNESQEKDNTVNSTDVKNDTLNQENQEEKVLSDNNILLISEKENKVFLPYKVNKLEEILNNSKNKYKSLEDVINKQYVLPLSRIKYPVLARFKEAFYLMKNKEKASLTECLDLAFELSFNSSLNPAVIIACNNLNELDIYLDCLENNELDKFTIFDIQYDISPLKK